ncbi:MATE family efflux transporter [Paludicola sp. MB14-C6]|uniref:MATE family efflux transporter n=1 Tax=Paludihabitans sp. MB14-C6 TaxID=3070656 RepID=UPI0027DDC004|nr:MATE family efflux transporter [Paludicola sp. MB14-C6]WMJ24223.1 MATE family efflux transporter [Paludicola sp. MB14-C6]
MKPFTKFKSQNEETRLSHFLTNQLGSKHFTYKQILSMLVPLILDQFFIFFIGTLTTFMISASGEDSVAAVTLVGPITFLIVALFSSVSAGGTVIVAQYKGKGDEKQMRRAAGQVVLTTFLVATIGSLILILFAEPIINTLFHSADPTVKLKAKNYMIGICLSNPAFSIFNGIFNVLRGVGDTKTCLRLTIVINVIHLFASYLFINICKLDILGTAISLNLARFIGCAIALYLILRPNDILTLKLKDMFQFRWSIQKAIIKIGIPFSLEQVFFNLGRMLTQVYMIQLGQSAIAADAIASSGSNLFYSAGFAVATLAITVVGQCIGAGDIKQAKKYGKKLIGLGTVCMLISVAVLYPFMPLIIKLSNPSATIIPMIHQAMLIGVIAIPFFWSSSYVMPSVLRAGGDAGFTSIVSLVIMWIARVALGYILAITLGLGLNGMWISMGVEWAARAIIFQIRFKGDKWHKKNLIA